MTDITAFSVLTVPKVLTLDLDNSLRRKYRAPLWLHGRLIFFIDHGVNFWSCFVSFHFSLVWLSKSDFACIDWLYWVGSPKTDHGCKCFRAPPRPLPRPLPIVFVQFQYNLTSFSLLRKCLLVPFSQDKRLMERDCLVGVAEWDGMGRLRDSNPRTSLHGLCWET